MTPSSSFIALHCTKNLPLLGKFLLVSRLSSSPAHSSKFIPLPMDSLHSGVDVDCKTPINPFVLMTRHLATFVGHRNGTPAVYPNLAESLHFDSQGCNLCGFLRWFDIHKLPPSESWIYIGPGIHHPSVHPQSTSNSKP